MAKKKFIIFIVVLLSAALLLVGLSLYGKAQLAKVPDLTFSEALLYTLEDNKDAVITVGIIQGGQTTWKVYGENAKKLPDQLHTYEIGSLTKTFTAALINQAIDEGKIELNATIDNYLQLPERKHYPTIKELVTHTSGYKGYYFETPMIGNFFSGKNSFNGVSREMVLARARSLDLDQENYDFKYSNFGFAVLGLVLEAVYESDYTALLNDYVQNDLGLSATKISEQDGDLGKYWDWQLHDAYMPAGAMTSDIEDMLRYAQMQLNDPRFGPCHKSLKTIDDSTETFRALGINLDEIAMAWIIDKENGFIWHNGGTGHYNSYLGFCPETETAVVILSNLASGYRLPATVLGIKLLQELGG
ncbi:MAG: serine hydrolase domain-containing protein [Eubacteriales bacterium]|nr:serine hydrolase domain-containing protein [Eubacteriales bacterium]